MKSLTIITTTYNRGYCIKQVYDSLVRQECKDFIWLIVDDGSTDDTKNIVEGFIEEGLIDIEYYYKPNGGMHTARNFAYQRVNTELNTIIDSDDWLAEGAVQHIISYWNTKKQDKYAGIITQNIDPQGNIIGSSFPKDLISCRYRDFFGKLGMRGDKKLVLQTKLTKQYPFPEFNGEKFYPASYKYYMLDKDYEFLVDNFATCIVNYNNDSMTRDKYSQYKTCPYGFMHFRKTMVSLNLGFKQDLKNMIHYFMECNVAKTKPEKEVLKKPLSILCYIPGKLLYIYLMNTKRRY